MDLQDQLIMLLENNNIAYNSTIVAKLAERIEDMIVSGDIANPDPDFAEGFVI
jgi:hypothetical protein